MGTGYTRNDVGNNIADGNVINASDLDGEFDAVEDAFDAATGHTHDGTAAEGGPITKLGPTQDVDVGATAVTPNIDNTVDLGSSLLEFKDLYIDGTANIDSLVADTADINAGTIDGATLGTNSAITEAQIDNININGNSIISTNTDGNIALTPNGTGEVDISKVDIDAGTIDGVTLGTNSAITEAQIDNININGNSITSTNTDGNITLDPDGTGAIELSGPVSVADNLVTRPILKDYSVEGSAIGATGATATIDMEVANFFSATIDEACTFTFSNPPASGDFGAFVLELTNGGAFTVTWPASVDFPGGTAPTLTASGVDQLVFTTRDGGTTYFGFVAGLDIKTPA